jgi:hypothetical protein
VNPTQLDQLRDALRHDTEQLQPVGLGVETVQRRGKRRRNRGRALVSVTAATCLAGVGLSLTHRESGHHVLDIAGQSPTTPPPALDFRVVDGAVGYATHFTSSDGVTYALSTAPSGVGTPEQPGQAIYSTTDGEHWTTADQGRPWISDLTAGDGVLYAIGTAPGAGTNDVSYRVGTSRDGGQQWTDTDLPFEENPPSATVSLSRAASVQLAHSGSTTVALLTENYFPDLDALVAARTAGHENVGTQPTDAGFDMVDYSGCVAEKQRVVGSTTTVPTDSPDPTVLARGANCDNPPVLGTITWSDIGLNSGADLARRQMLVSSDGTHWDHTTAPAAEFATDLVADDDGFLLLADSGKSMRAEPGLPETSLLHSADGRVWTTVTTAGDLSIQAINGSRIIGVDTAGAVQTSTDGGATWTATNVGAQLPAGAPAATVQTTDAGPLGFAVVVNADDQPKDQTRGHDYLLFSTDGITWSTSDLATAGAPADGYPMQVMVGADHIGIDYEGPGTVPNGPMKITTLLATPKR